MTEENTKKETKWEAFKWELNYFLSNKFLYPYKNIKNGFSNLIKYRSIIWHDRWWDYSFTLNMLLFKLKDTEEHWGKDTHYVNDLDDKKMIQEIIEDLEWMVDENNDDFSNNFEEEYKKRSKRMFGKLDRNHRKFWD